MSLRRNEKEGAMRMILVALACTLFIACSTTRAAAPPSVDKGKKHRDADRLWKEAARIARTIEREFDAAARPCDKLDPEACVPVDFFAAAVKDAHLEPLGKLPRIGWLILGNKQVTDASLKHLTGLTQLQILILDGTKVTD